MPQKPQIYTDFLDYILGEKQRVNNNLKDYIGISLVDYHIMKKDA